MSKKIRVCRDCGCRLTKDNCGPSQWNTERNICRICRAAYDRKYHRSHREERALYGREYYLAHREEHATHNRKYYQQNKDKVKIINRLWREANPDKVAQIQRRRDARKRGAEGTHTLAEWQALCEAVDHRCLACGKQVPLTVDHIVPLSKGGSNWIDNIQPLCLSCNIMKGVRTTSYWPRVIPVGCQNCRSV